MQSLSTDFGLVTSSTLKLQFQENIRKRYIDKVIENLEDRFPDADLLLAFNTIFHSTSALEVHQRGGVDFGRYGKSAIVILTDHFNVSIDKTRLENEWMSFKHILLSEFSDSKPSDHDVMSALADSRTLSSLYPSLAKIASIALTIPISTASCERGFSTMNRINTTLRNRLTSDSMDKLIRISSEGPSLEDFDFDKAVDMWSSKCNRRIKV